MGNNNNNLIPVDFQNFYNGRSGIVAWRVAVTISRANKDCSSFHLHPCTTNREPIKDKRGHQLCVVLVTLILHLSDRPIDVTA